MIKKLFFILIFLLIPSYSFAFVSTPIISGSSGGTNYLNDASIEFAAYMNANGGNETDRSGNENTLTETSGTIPRSSDVPDGYSGFSRDFEKGDIEWLEHADGLATDIYGDGQAVSFGCWVKLESFSTDAGVMGKYFPAANQRGYALKFELTGTLIEGFIGEWGGSDSQGTATASSSPTVGIWEHWAVVYDGSTIKIYKNGVLDSNGSDNPKSYTDGLQNSSIAFVIGKFQTKYVDGLIDEPWVFSRDLSATEILEIKTYGIDGSNGAND